MERGRKARIQWRRGEQRQARVLVSPRAAEERELAFEIRPTANQVLGGQVWYALKPDLDACPRLLCCPP